MDQRSQARLPFLIETPAGQINGVARYLSACHKESLGRCGFSACQNSTRARKAIMRGELSPPNPTPSRPVGGDVVDVKAPKPVCVEGLPGIPAVTLDGRLKFGWLNRLKNWPSMRSFKRSRRVNHLVMYRSLQMKSGPRRALRPRLPNRQLSGVLPPVHAPV